jgi:protein gp37
VARTGKNLEAEGGMNKTSIEWTHRPGTIGMTWNPIRARRKSDGKVGWACTHASTGCLHCYAETINKRFGTGLPFNVPSLDQVEFFLDDRILQQPLRQKKPATIFVGDMFDLFHEAIGTSKGELTARVFAMMIRCQQHTFQLLTKRAENMKLWMECADIPEYRSDFPGVPFPPPNMWFGVSIENRKCKERADILRQIPAVIRFLSIEPLLEDVGRLDLRGISWVIVGGESGAGARMFDPTWAFSIRNQCEAAGVPFFMKQLGSKVFGMPFIESAKGGDMTEWPEFLRVREFPKAS